MVELLISRDNEGRRLDRVLSSYLNLADNAFLHKMLRKKNIVLNGKKADGSVRVKKDDVVTLYLADETVAKFRSADRDAGKKREAARYAYETVTGDARGAEALRPQILYEDDALLLLNKPQGVLSQKDRSGKPSVNEWAIGYLLKNGSISEEALTAYTPSEANRLDRNTSGLLVFTKTRAAARAFANMQREKQLHKTYRAVVCGMTNEEDAVYESVKRDDAFNRMRVEDLSDDAGKALPTLTYIRLAHLTDPALSLLGLTLSEGKKHQIRAQMANLGHPVLMDDKYGDRSLNRKIAEQLSRAGESLLSGMQLLHSFSLSFPAGLAKDHPLAGVSGKTFVAPYPPVFERLMLSFYRGKNVVYILQCADVSLYCGWTNDIASRIKAHNEGKGAKYTRGRGPVHPLYLRAFDTKEEAMKEEARIKGLSHEEKKALLQ